LLVEGGLSQPALSPMEIAFTGEQPFAQEMLGELEPAALVEPPGLVDQHVLDEVRVIEQVNPTVAQADKGHIPVVAGHALEQTERIAAEDE
jgi:hypothetical protein